MTTAEMIDITRMKTLYAHLQNNPDISHILQVEDNNEKLLAEVGDAMLIGDLVAFENYIKEGKIIKLMQGNSSMTVPETNAVYCLYLPPYYLFTDLKRVYQ